MTCSLVQGRKPTVSTPQCTNISKKQFGAPRKGKKLQKRRPQVARQDVLPCLALPESSATLHRCDQNWELYPGLSKVQQRYLEQAFDEGKLHPGLLLFYAMGICIWERNQSHRSRILTATALTQRFVKRHCTLTRALGDAADSGNGSIEQSEQENALHKSTLNKGSGLMFQPLNLALRCQSNRNSEGKRGSSERLKIGIRTSRFLEDLPLPTDGNSEPSRSLSVAQEQ